MEIAVNLALLAIFNIAASRSIVDAFHLPIAAHPFVWILFLGIAIAVQIPGRQYWFVLSAVALTVVSLVLWLVFVLGTAPQVDSSVYGGEAAHYTDNAASRGIHAVSIGAVPTIFYAGIEVLPVLGRVSKEPKRAVPIALYVTSAFSIVYAISTVFVATTQYPGASALFEDQLPLRHAFQRLFQTQSSAVSLLNLPFVLASLMAGMFSLGRVVKSMSESGLLPAVLSKTWGSSQFPYPAMLAFSSSTLIGSGIIFAVEQSNMALLLNLASFFGWSLFVVYGTIFVTYLSFLQRFPRLTRKFRSPFGAWGAYIGIFVFSVMSINMLFYPNCVYVLLCFIASCGLYYLLYHRVIVRYQRFCAEEEKVMFIALVLKGIFMLFSSIDLEE